MSAPAPVSGAELLTITLDASFEDKGKHKVDIENISVTAGTGIQDITFVDADSITEIEIKGFNGAGKDPEDNVQDVFRFDLSTFNDDFDITVKDETSLDIFYIEGFDTEVDNGDGTFTYTYTGSDGLTHTATLDPGNAQVQSFTSDGIVEGLATGEVMAPGYTDADGDIIDGADGNDDIIRGNGGDDTITAGLGADTVEGGAGADSMDGGAGTDELTYENSGAGVSVTLGSGSGSGGDAQGDTNTGFENLTGSAFNDTLTGDTGNNIINAGGGDDTVEGGAGADSMDGGAGTDELTYENSGAGVSVTLGSGTGSGGDAQGDTNTGFENLTGSAFNDTLTGDGSDNTIDGGEGDDILDGGFGEDSLIGGDDNDSLIGDSESVAEPLLNTISYSYAQDINGDPAAHFGDLGTNSIDDPENLFDNDLSTGLRLHENDIIEFDFGQTLLAGTSITLRDESAGEDAEIQVYVSSGSTDPSGDANSGAGGGVGYQNAVTDGQSTLVYSGLSGSDVTFILPIDATHIQFVGIDNHGDFGEIELTGLLSGGSGAPLVDPPPDTNDTLVGGAGNDTLDGVYGDDSLEGGIGNDSILASLGSDIIDGGTGLDTFAASGGLSVTDAQIEVTVDNNGNGSVVKSTGGTDTLTSVENFIADEVIGQTDVITISDTNVDPGDDAIGTRFLRSEVSGLDDNSIGTFTLASDGTVINFGPGSDNSGVPGVANNIVLSQILDNSTPGVSSAGTIQITSGDESGTVGSISFENFEQINFDVVCFLRGTLIKTKDGERPIETLTVGDFVLTMDENYQPIRWIGSRELDSIDLTLNPKLKPIIIRADALGRGYPNHDLIVSPQHRIFVDSMIAERMFGLREVLIPANKLLTLDGVDIIEHYPGGLEYWHMLFDAHQIVWSNGTPTESLFTGPEALKALTPEAQLEILTLFPKLCDPEFKPTTARYVPEKGKLMRKLAQRHKANKKPLVPPRL